MGYLTERIRELEKEGDDDTREAIELAASQAIKGLLLHTTILDGVLSAIPEGWRYDAEKWDSERPITKKNLAIEWLWSVI